MYLGKIVELADADELFDHPRHPVHRRAAVAPCRFPTRGWRARSSARSSAATCPSPTNPPPACRFHTRCPKAHDGVCDVDEPLLEVKEGGNLAACHFPLTDEEIAERGARPRRRERRALRERRRSTRRARARPQDAAAAVGCEVGQICKSLVFRVGDEPLLVIAVGANRVDEARFGAEKADAAFVREQTGFAIGGVPPFGHVRADRDDRRRGPAGLRRRCGPRRARRRRSSRSRPTSWCRRTGGRVERVA